MEEESTVSYFITKKFILSQKLHALFQKALAYI